MAAGPVLGHELVDDGNVSVVASYTDEFDDGEYDCVDETDDETSYCAD